MGFHQRKLNTFLVMTIRSPGAPAHIRAGNAERYRDIRINPYFQAAPPQQLTVAIATDCGEAESFVRCGQGYLVAGHHGGCFFILVDHSRSQAS